MSHMLAKFPSRQTTSGRSPRSQQSRSYQVEELSAAPDRVQNRRYILRVFVVAPVLVCLAAYAIIEMPEIMVRTGHLLNGTSGRFMVYGASFLAGVSEWLPVLLVLLSSAVLTCMGFITLRDQRTHAKPMRPELVPTSIPAVEAEAPPAVKAEVGVAAGPGRPFLVERNERRHAAQEAVRLSRDARASAAQRAAAVSRLRIQPASSTFQPLEAPEPVVRFRTLPRRREPAREKKPIAMPVPSGDSCSRPANPPPNAIA